MTVFGGYTGQFAEALRGLGIPTIFTDVSQEWVEEAKVKGFEAYAYAVQDIPIEIYQRTDLFASFECYPDLFEEDEYQYNKMRLLTSRLGIFFVESRATVKSLWKDPEQRQKLGTFRRSFRPLNSVYGLKRESKIVGDLDFYHIFANEEKRGLIMTDCVTMKTIHETFESDHRIKAVNLRPLVQAAGLDRAALDSSLQRLKSMSDSIHAPFLRSMPFLAHQLKNEIRIGTKRYWLDLD